MSKIGEKNINIPEGVNVVIDKKNITIKGPQGEMFIDLPVKLNIIKQDKSLLVKRLDDEKKTKSLHGTYRQLISNAISGVQKMWEKKLKVVGTGFGVKLEKDDLVFKIGYSHPVTFKKIAGVKFQVQGNNAVVVLSCDKQLVGQTAFQIKILKKPDVYKGKGIQYEGEKIRIKPGKKAKAAGGPVQ